MAAQCWVLPRGFCHTKKAKKKRFKLPAFVVFVFWGALVQLLLEIIAQGSGSGDRLHLAPNGPFVVLSDST
jgi:hypothetical protein